MARIIDKLRVIHLYKADYILILKILWALKLVWNAHNHTSINDGQSGSCPGRKEIDVMIQKEKKYLYTRLTLSMIDTMDNDAKSCYDRIISNLAMLVSRYCGMPLNVCKTQVSTLKNMIFSFKTTMGISQSSYQHTNATPIHGSEQGSCASPCIWLLISSLLMDCLIAGKVNRVDTTTRQVKSPDNHVKQWIDGFVDDTSNFCNTIISNHSIGDLATQLQEDATIWANLLAASGGKPELARKMFLLPPNMEIR